MFFLSWGGVAQAVENSGNFDVTPSTLLDNPKSFSAYSNLSNNLKERNDELIRLNDLRKTFIDTVQSNLNIIKEESTLMALFSDQKVGKDFLFLILKNSAPFFKFDQNFWTAFAKSYNSGKFYPKLVENNDNPQVNNTRYQAYFEDIQEVINLQRRLLDAIKTSTDSNYTALKNALETAQNTFDKVEKTTKNIKDKDTEIKEDLVKIAGGGKNSNGTYSNDLLNLLNKIATTNFINQVNNAKGNKDLSYVAGLRQQSQQNSLASSLAVFSQLNSEQAGFWINYDNSATKYQGNNAKNNGVILGVDNQLPAIPNVKVGIYAQAGKSDFKQEYPVVGANYQLTDKFAGAGTYIHHQTKINQFEVFNKGLLGVSTHHHSVEIPQISGANKTLKNEFTGLTAAVESGLKYQINSNFDVSTSIFYAVNHETGAELDDIHYNPKSTNLQNMGANIDLGYQVLALAKVKLNLNYTHIKYPNLGELKTDKAITADNKFAANLVSQFNFWKNHAITANVGYKKYQKLKNKGINFGVGYQIQF